MKTMKSSIRISLAQRLNNMKLNISSLLFKNPIPLNINP